MLTLLLGALAVQAIFKAIDMTKKENKQIAEKKLEEEKAKTDGKEPENAKGIELAQKGVKVDVNAVVDETQLDTPD